MLQPGSRQGESEEAAGRRRQAAVAHQGLRQVAHLGVVGPQGLEVVPPTHHLQATHGRPGVLPPHTQLLQQGVQAIVRVGQQNDGHGPLQVLRPPASCHLDTCSRWQCPFRLGQRVGHLGAGGRGQVAHWPVCVEMGWRWDGQRTKPGGPTRWEGGGGRGTGSSSCGGRGTPSCHTTHSPYSHTAEGPRGGTHFTRCSRRRPPILEICRGEAQRSAVAMCPTLPPCHYEGGDRTGLREDAGQNDDACHLRQLQDLDIRSKGVAVRDLAQGEGKML